MKEHLHETRSKGGFPALMKKLSWRVCDVRDLAGVDYTTAADWKKSGREMRLGHAARLYAAALDKGESPTVLDFLPAEPKRGRAA